MVQRRVYCESCRDTYTFNNVFFTYHHPGKHLYWLTYHCWISGIPMEDLREGIEGKITGTTKPTLDNSTDGLQKSRWESEDLISQR